MRALLIFLTFLASLFLVVVAQAAPLADQTEASLKKYKTDYNFETVHHDQRGLELLKLERVLSLSNGAESAIVVDFAESGIQYTLKYTRKAAENPELLAPNLTILESLKPRWKTDTIYTSSEIRYNAQYGSLVSQYKLAGQDSVLLRNQAQRKNIEEIFSQGDEALKTKIKESILNKAAELEKLQADLYPKVLQQQKQEYKALETWRKDSGTLEAYEKQADKLNDLLLKNDRKGVRKMLEAYLPWNLMDALETQAWKQWLEAIENPNPEKSLVLLRGIDYATDKVQTLKLPNGEVKIAFMSSVLTKNQGNYTRRLRSLTTKREQNGRLSDKLPGALLTQQWRQHAKDPIGSSFLSFTLDPSVAFTFKGSKQVGDKNGLPIYASNGGMLAVRIDERRIFPNLPSLIGSEVEYLAPLVIFPDEIVVFKDFAESGHKGFIEFQEEVTKKTGIDFQKQQFELVKKYVPQGRKFLNSLTQQPLSGHNQCSKVFAN